MPSIVSGFENDIFISYRHNDNRSGWVTDFVNALQEELAATIKKPLSIYFDKNPHDGLLETHQVDKSLEGKLKCLIFIPIISQTYCDTKSFAWQYEFCAFNKLSKADQFGRDIKLSNGNVASRILPVKIHDLDPEDKAIIEMEIGGVLRAIDFIYKEPGVNRPLKSSDNKSDNQNKTDYRNQVNKMANAIKEIILAIKSPKLTTQSTNINQPVITQSNSRRKVLFISGTLILLFALAAYFIFKDPVAKNPPPVADQSIAVLPFVNMSGDPEQEYFSDGLSEELLNLLTKIPDLRVIARTSSFSFKGTKEDIRSIGKKLEVSHILEGSVRRSGNKVRITAQLIRINDGAHLWSETYDRTMEDILAVQDEIAISIARTLNRTFQEMRFRTTTNTEAYNLISQANYYLYKNDSLSRFKAIELLQQALVIDSLNAELMANLALSYHTIRDTRAIELAEKAYKINPENDMVNWAMGMTRLQSWNWTEADKYLTAARKLNPIARSVFIASKISVAERLGHSNEAIEVAKESIRLNPYSRSLYFIYGRVLIHSGKYEDAMQQANKLMELGTSPTWPYELKAEVFLLQGKYDKALAEITKITRFDQPKLFLLCLVYFSLQQKDKADQLLSDYIEKYKNSSAFSIAEIYAWRGETQEALKWLELSFQRRENGLYNINASSWLHSLKKDARYQAIVKEMNLPI